MTVEDIKEWLSMEATKGMLLGLAELRQSELEKVLYSEEKCHQCGVVEGIDKTIGFIQRGGE